MDEAMSGPGTKSWSGGKEAARVERENAEGIDDRSGDVSGDRNGKGHGEGNGEGNGEEDRERKASEEIEK
ncbi:hypothetical protein VC83_08763 [Pseudogymnoascus destructans]|uniref:Uncharacterized protein n=1 Tax=Pseudogymnoascus destructans TaxID=655981 RepID=A0A177A0G8_9PEZI|nr:uncharacterized protein VC83_08763 [Pseudogymnoascus destructans]OAF55070.1 hypothetical protein VC83_08763 [Pseudogymnoascus destructans]